MRQQAQAKQLRRIEADKQPRLGDAIRRAAANFWLDFCFFHARYAPWLLRHTQGFFLWWAWGFSRHIRVVTTTNAKWLLGKDSTRAQRKALAKRVIDNFVCFIIDIGCTSRMSRQQLEQQVAAIEGHEAYQRARDLKRGAIIATAHMGSFELGMTAMLKSEKNIHVVFQRDALQLFEQLRSEFRRRMGIHEAAVDEGWAVWLRLRDALQRDEVVAIQADRVMPGQKGIKVPFLGGHSLFPEGPAKLAAITGAPIIPIFTLRLPDGRVRICIEEAIEVSGTDDIAIREAIAKLSQVVGKYVKAYPEQWLVLHRAWCEDEVQTKAEGQEQETA
jgi:phosphatidylinositol dimannoside acyltransferase